MTSERPRSLEPGSAGGLADDRQLDAGQQPPVGVVIVSWNVRELLADCLSSLFASSRPLEVVVVDNGSEDGSCDMLRNGFPQVRLIANESNAGFTRANNQGIRALRQGTGEQAPPDVAPDYVLLLNPDTTVVGEAVGGLSDYLSLHEEVGIVGPELRYPDGSPQSSCRRFPTLLTAIAESTPVEWHWRGNPFSMRLRMADTSPPEGPVDWVTGAAMLVRVAALDQVGLFDEGFFMYSEELDLCRRFKDAGWEVHFTPKARILHHEGASSDQVVGLRHKRFFASRVRYFAKHHSAGSALIVRVALTGLFAAEMLAESLKWLLGHRRSLRRDRVGAYADVVSTLWGDP